jgi:sporulation protein YlmC with PRC-barrel domain/ribosomal protein L40E
MLPAEVRAPDLPDKGKFVPAQRFVGMQVIDSKGMVVGNVKDVSVDFQEKTLAFLVTTKNRTDLDIPWENVLSIEDVILLKTEIELPEIAEAEKVETVVSVGQALIICPNCGASAPGHAKFCPRCGHSMK